MPSLSRPLPVFVSLLALLLAGTTVTGCDSPPRMWAKRINRAINEQTPTEPRETFEKAASDAATAEAYARLCGVETKPMEPALRSFLGHRDVQRPDVLWESYRLRRDRLIEENQSTIFHPGECWQRGQDFSDVLAAVKAGQPPRYEGLDLWK